MIMFKNIPEVWLYSSYVDFRKSINGLAVLIEQQLHMQIQADTIYVFCNKGRDKLKVLYWDNTGFALWYKRLEQHKFKWPTLFDQDKYQLTEAQFHWLLQGFDVVGHQSVALQHFA